MSEKAFWKSEIKQRSQQILAVVGEVAAETLWPTRCALCEKPGQVLCNACLQSLPYLDWWRACPRCGAAYGATQCTACNDTSLAQVGRVALPYEGWCTATMFQHESTGHIVRVFKDQGEQRLANVMAACMARALPVAWKASAVTFVPATLAAYRRRGFDHGQLLASRFARLVDLPLVYAFERPIARDQRGLSRMQRLKNTQSRFHVKGALGEWGNSRFPERQSKSAALERWDKLDSLAGRHDSGCLKGLDDSGRLKGWSSAVSLKGQSSAGRLKGWNGAGSLVGRSSAGSLAGSDNSSCLRGQTLLLVDDVGTTGATLMEACDALLLAGVACVYCVTFARV